MLDNIKNEDVLFLDIETVPQQISYEELPSDLKPLWDKKAGFLARNEETPDELYQRAGIYAEFGKIICISIGMLYPDNGRMSWNLRLKTFYNDNERILLGEFIELLNSIALKKDIYLCAHNGKEFDFPYIARRILIHGLRLPKVLDTAGKKPWEVTHLDTLELWRFGDYKHFTSLNLLTAIFGIPSPKDDIDGSQVASVYWEERDLKRIVKYCEKDVVALVQLFLKYKGESMVEEGNIHSITT